MKRTNHHENVNVYGIYRSCGNNIDDRGGYNNEAFVC